MILFLANLILACIWGAMSGDMTIANLTLGFIVGYIILLLSQRLTGDSRYFTKVWATIRFLLYFIKELLVSSFRVAYDIVTPTTYNRPGIIAYPVGSLSAFEATLLAKVISLTPGTLSMDISEDGQWLYIHAMFIDDPEELKRDIQRTLEAPLLEVLR
jgi:multicomponent Na+:H+ antiporter subunit E